MDTNTPGPPSPEPAGKSPTPGAVADWLVASLARLLNCQPADIDVTASYDRLGLDSALVVQLTLDLEDWLGTPIEPGIFFDYPTIQRLAEELARRVSSNGREKSGLDS